MKTQQKTTSQWESLDWKKVDVNNSSNDNDIDDSEFLNAKNHYDDPDADPSELYGSGKSSEKYDYSLVEGADDPGIFVGLEVIDGSQYQVEKIKVGKGTSAGYITRLIIDGDTKDKFESNYKEMQNNNNSDNNKEIKRSTKKIKDVQGKLEKGEGKAKTEKSELTRKQRNRIKFEEILAKRKEKKLERKRKQNDPSKNDDVNNGIDKNLNEESISKKKCKVSNQSSVAKTITEPAISKENVNSIQSSWAAATGGVYLHDKICASLHQMGFNSPTPIQASTLAASILGQRDVVGAAPTGSGKTLSYLMPILQFLLSASDIEDGDADIESKRLPLIAMILCPTRELALQVSNEYSKLICSTIDEPYHNSIKCGSIVGGLSEQKQKRVLDVKRPPVIVGTPGRLWDLMSSGEHGHLSDLTQLRFLVIDEADRMIAQNSFPQLQSILEKVRMANPSLEDMLKHDSDSDDDEDDDRLQSLPGVRGEAKVAMLNDDILKMIEKQRNSEKPLVIHDEVDEGEDIELGSDVSEQISSDEDDEEFVKRQTFIFSATLTLPGSDESIKVKNQSKASKSINGAIAEILEKVGAQGETKVVDLSTEIVNMDRKQKAVKDGNDQALRVKKEFKLPPGLSLYQIRCTQKHKDSHLYSFLTTTKQGSSGPCLVFCNSINAVKRVGATLKTLGLPARMLHAHMQQKARISAVESLTGKNTRAIVIATDVAARGLDIPSVATVIHYDVARAADLFVHRAGRTARGMGDNAIGWSVSLVSAPEEKSNQRICERILGLGIKEFEEAPMDGRLLSAAHKRVDLATKLVAFSDVESKIKKKNKWFIDAANEADLDIDDDILDDGIDNVSAKDRQSIIEAKRAKEQLKILLATPMRTQSFGKFLSGAGVKMAIETEQEVKPYLVKAEDKKKSKRKYKS